MKLPKRPKRPQLRSSAPRFIQNLAMILNVSGISTAQEYQFMSPRLWRFDLALPDHKIAVEYEGGTHGHGRHTRGVGYHKDCQKYNAAALAGWTVLRFTVDDAGKEYELADIIAERIKHGNTTLPVLGSIAVDNITPIKGKGR